MRASSRADDILGVVVVAESTEVEEESSEIQEESSEVEERTMADKMGKWGVDDSRWESVRVEEVRTGQPSWAKSVGDEEVANVGVDRTAGLTMFEPGLYTRTEVPLNWLEAPESPVCEL